MCYERYTRRERQQAEESRKIWQDFGRTTPISDPAPPDVGEPDVVDPEVTEPQRAETVTASDR
jgi:hypothetical protein